MRKKNKGLSLVELVIVIAIMAIAAGIGFYSFSNVSRYRAKECSKKITSNLEQTKITTLGKAKWNGDIVWELYRSGNSYYVRYCTDCGGANNVHDQYKISKGRVEVYYEDASNNRVHIDKNKALKLCFDRATGKLYSCGNGILSTPGSPYNVISTDTTTSVRKIIVTGGGSEYITELVPATGKIIK